MNRLASNIERKVKTSNKNSSDNDTNSIKKQEYEIRSPHDYTENDYENYADSLM